MFRKRWADLADLKRCIFRSRRRTTWYEFSARLFIHKLRVLFGLGSFEATNANSVPDLHGATGRALYWDKRVPVDSGDANREAVDQMVVPKTA